MKHSGANLRKQHYTVEPIAHAEWRAFVEKFHYSSSASNTPVYAYGLFYQGGLVGVALWMPPTRVAAESVNKANWRRVLALSRLAVHPEAPRNAATFLLGRSTRLIKRDGLWRWLVTYADTWQNHTGAIYLATGWRYVGETKKSPVWVNDAGVMRGRKRGPRTLTRAEMVAEGFSCLGSFSKHKFVKTL
jgi:hypothetical protein